MTSPFKTVHQVPYSSIAGCGLMLKDDRGHFAAHIAIMAGDKETSDAISDELVRRIRTAPQPQQFHHSDDVISAARELRDALMEDSPYGNSEMGEDWFLREYPAVASLSEQQTEAEGQDQ